MNKLEEIKHAISAITQAQQEKLYEWLDQHRSSLFDARIKADAAAGRLDGIIARVLENHREGRTKQL